MFNNLLATQNIPEQAQILIRNYFLIMVITAIVNGLIIVFYSLFLIHLFGVLLVSFLLAVAQLVQFVTDFPSGVLSDWFGQKKIAFISIFLLGIGNILTGVVTDFNLFIFIMIIDGISLGLYNGTIQTWFSNNYHSLMTLDTDTDRSIYGKIIARVRSLALFLLSIFIIIGTQLSTDISRNFVFILAGIICIGSSITFLSLMKDFYKISNEKDEQSCLQKQSLKQNIKEYFQRMYDFFRYLFHNKILLSTLIGLLFFYLAIGDIFMYLLLYPIIFSYTKNDIILGLSQTILYFIFAINVFFISIVAKKLRTRYFSLLCLFYAVFFFSILSLTVDFFPPTNSLNGMIGLLIILTTFLFFYGLVNEIIHNLQSRIFLDLISSKYRNSTYSTYSSASAILTSIFYIIIGLIITLYGLTNTLLFLGMISLFGCIFLLPIFFKK